MQYLLLILAGAIAGAMNSIAGGGIFVVLPALIVAGLSGKQANASGSFAVWIGQVTSLLENRNILPQKSRLIKQVIALGLFGSIVGALLLIYTPNIDFEHALPYLNAAATLIFIAGPWLRKKRSAHAVPGFVFPLFLLFVGIYGGYFGGGLGMLMLAALGMSQLQDVKQQNAVKLLAASIINATSLILLILASLVIWRFALSAGAGALLGGYLGSRYSKGISQKTIRIMVISIGIATTIYLFIRF